MSLTTLEGPRPVLAADLFDRLKARLASAPALSWLAPELVELELDRAVLKLPYRPELTNGSGTVHGGILATLADSATAFALSTNFDGRMGFATADLTIHFFRRVRSDVWARARIVKKGRRANVGDVEIVDAKGDVHARVLTTYLLTTSSFEYTRSEGKE